MISGNLTIQLGAGRRWRQGPWWQGNAFDRPYAKIYCMVGGEAFIEHSGRTFVLTPGNIYLIPPRSNHSYRCESWSEIAWFHFNGQWDGVFDIFNTFSWRHVYAPADFAATLRRVERVNELRERKTAARRFEMLSVVTGLLLPFIEGNAPRQDPYQLARMRPVLQHIDTHLGSPLTVAQLAGIASYETSHFSVRFKELFGLAPYQFIQKRRIERAMHLLLATNDKILTIAAKLGFSSQYHFSTAFRRHVSCSPSEYRSKAQASGEDW